MNTLDSSERLLAWTPPASLRPTRCRGTGLVAASVLAGALFATAPAHADEAPALAQAAPPVAETSPAGTVPPAEAPAPVVPAAPAPADTTTVAKVASPPTPVVPPVPPPPPYSLPWQLRPLGVANVIRSDTSVAFYKDAAGNAGSTQASTLLASYKITSEFAPIIRLGWVKNDAPGMGVDGSSFLNPIVAGAYSHKIDSFRLAGFLGTTIPIGQGGGQMPNAGAATADAAGISARSGMDNAMFAVNYMTAIVGAGFGYVSNGFTAQVEATLLELIRVRGNDLTGSAADSARTNSTFGLHLGYFVIPQLSLGGELRYQRWLSTPHRLAMGAKTPFADANMDTVTFAVGPRAHFKISKTMWLRPGVSYSQGLDKPLSDSKYHTVQVDIPFSF